MSKNEWREISPEEHKKRALEILLEVADFCEKNNFRYYLAYGTLIGAVRHKGFIPWDDDIDIQMPRPDYDRFAEAFNAANRKRNLLAIMPTDKIAKHTFMKVCDMDTKKIEGGFTYKNEDYLGIDIDIFPLDGMSKDDAKYKKEFYKRKKLYGKYVKMNSSLYTADLTLDLISFAKFAWRSWIVLQGKFYNLFDNCDELLEKMHEEEVKIPYGTAEMVGTMCSFYDYFGDRHPKSCFDKYIYVDFERHKFRAPIGYDEVLKNEYGDYMTPPPENKQETHHVTRIFVKNK